jgi:hypothetical protein
MIDKPVLTRFMAEKGRHQQSTVSRGVDIASILAPYPTVLLRVLQKGALGGCRSLLEACTLLCHPGGASSSRTAPIRVLAQKGERRGFLLVADITIRGEEFFSPTA